jgi:DNA-binding HxlR family transcriptional regulator
MKSNNKKPSSKGRYSYDNLTRIIHEKARLGIITSLLANKKGLSFNELKELCSLSDGNLSRHMQALEEYKFIEVKKGYEGRKPKTIYKITPLGEKEFVKYLNELEKVIHDANDVIKAKTNVNKLNIKYS